MNFFTFIFTLFASSQVLAHTDHVLSEGGFHTIYHTVFWGIFIVVTVKALRYFKKLQIDKADN
jgi:hypothetical protein